MPDPNVATAVFKATNATTGRALSDHVGDIFNVKSWGAVGNGIANDTASIQACFDAAFTNSGTPHGVTNATSNRAVFFPAGNYLTDQPLTLTDVYGGHIFGAGRFATVINNTTTSAIVINGFSNCLIEDLRIIAGGVSGVGIDLDWASGAGSVGLSHNIFLNLEIEGVICAIRVAHSGNEGHNNQFLACTISGTTAFLVEGTNAMNQYISGGGNSTSTTPYKCTGGSMHLFGVALSISDAASSDIYVSSGKPCSVVACRTESKNYFTGIGPGKATIIGGLQQPNAALGNFANITTGMGLITDTCVSSGAIVSGSTDCNLYIRNCTYASSTLDGYTGNLGQNI